MARACSVLFRVARYIFHIRRDGGHLLPRISSGYTEERGTTVCRQLSRSIYVGIGVVEYAVFYVARWVE